MIKICSNPDCLTPEYATCEDMFCRKCSQPLRDMDFNYADEMSIERVINRLSESIDALQRILVRRSAANARPPEAS